MKKQTIVKPYVFLGKIANSFDDIKDTPCIGEICIIAGTPMVYTNFGFIQLPNFVDYKNNIVIEFIRSFVKENCHEVKNLFLNGHCYWFAQILKTRFNGEIVYNPIDNHFACKIEDFIYDITGKIKDISHFEPWEEYQTKDSNETDRIYRDCIFKLSSDFSIDYEKHTCNDIYLRLKEDEK